MRTSLASLLTVVILGAALAGCGGQTSKRTSTAAGLEPPCRTRSRALVAREVGARAGAVSAVAGVASNSYPQCAYSSGAVRIVVNVDNGPQPYFVLERTAIERRRAVAVAVARTYLGKLVQPPGFSG